MTSKPLLRHVLATLLLMSFGTSAFAQTEYGPIELNMQRPEPRIASPPKGGYPKRGDSSLPGSAVAFNLVFDMSVSPANQALYNAAASAWQNRIPFYATGVGGPASITINVSEPGIDGPGGILGQAGPQFITNAGGFWLTTVGIMQFDAADVAGLVGANLYDDVIEHEMGHVIGVGTLWPANNVYINGSGAYTGVHGLTAWNAGFAGHPVAVSVPVELGGGPGTADGHWNEVDGGGVNTGITEISSGIDMRYETMTGWLDGPLNYSFLTHRSMADIGYDPNPAVVPVEVSEFSID